MKYRGNYITLTEQKRGLLCRLTREGRKEVRETKEQRPGLSDYAVFEELTDDIVGNSELFVGNADRLGQLSEAECVLTASKWTDEGPEFTDESVLYYFEEYQMQDLIQALMSGPVLFQRAN